MKSPVTRSVTIAIFVLGLFAATPARAQLDDRPVQTAGIRPALLHDVGLDQRLGSSIPLNLTFRDEHGRQVALNQLFGQSPVILSLVYYQCPMLCTEVLNGLVRNPAPTAPWKSVRILRS